MDDKQPVPIGIAAEHDRLQALAEPIGYRVFRLTHAHAAEVWQRQQADEWAVGAVGPDGAVTALVFRAATDAVAAAFLAMAERGMRLLGLAERATAAVAASTPRGGLEALLDDVNEIDVRGWEDVAVSSQGLSMALRRMLAIAITAQGRLGSRVGQELAALERSATVKREAALLRHLLRGPSEIL